MNRRDSEALVDLLCPDVEFFPILAALEGPVYGRVAWWRTYTDRAEAMRSVCDVRDQPAARSRCMRSISML